MKFSGTKARLTKGDFKKAPRLPFRPLAPKKRLVIIYKVPVFQGAYEWHFMGNGKLLVAVWNHSLYRQIKAMLTYLGHTIEEKDWNENNRT